MRNDRMVLVIQSSLFYAWFEEKKRKSSALVRVDHTLYPIPPFFIYKITNAMVNAYSNHAQGKTK
jgi:hypothetical protein